MKHLKQIFYVLCLLVANTVALAQMPDRGSWMAGGDDGDGTPSGGFPWVVASIWVAGIAIASFLRARAKTIALPLAQGWPLLFIVFETIAWFLRR